MATLRIEHLTFTYPRMDAPALSDVSLDFAPGTLTLLCGPSGCGKTTLLRHLKTVLTPHGRRDGAVTLDGGMIDKPMELRAQTTLAQARAAGIPV